MRTTIDIVSAYAGWRAVCPMAERLVYDAAELALVHGAAASVSERVPCLQRARLAAQAGVAVFP